MDGLVLYANADRNMQKLRDCIHISLRCCCRKCPFFMDPICQFAIEFASESRFPEHKITDGTSKVAVR